MCREIVFLGIVSVHKQNRHIFRKKNFFLISFVQEKSYLLDKCQPKYQISNGKKGGGRDTLPSSSSLKRRLSWRHFHTSLKEVPIPTLKSAKKAAPLFQKTAFDSSMRPEF